MKIIWVLAGWLVALAASGQEYKKKISSYRHLFVSRGVEVKLVPSGEREVTIRVNGLKPEDIIVESGRDELRIRLATKGLWQEMQDNYWWVKVEVPYRELAAVHVRTGAKVWSEEVVQADKLYLEVDMGGRAELEIEADELVAEVDMGSLAEISGRVNYLHIESSMGAEADLHKLQAGKVRAKAGMGSDVWVQATEEFDGQASMGGSIRVKGQPQRFYENTSMGGRIVHE